MKWKKKQKLSLVLWEASYPLCSGMFSQRELIDMWWSAMWKTCTIRIVCKGHTQSVWVWVLKRLIFLSWEAINPRDRDYVRIGAGSGKEVASEWFMFIFVKKQNKVTKGKAQISWRNETSGQMKRQCQGSLLVQLHKHGGPPLCPILCERRQIPKWGRLLWYWVSWRNPRCSPAWVVNLAKGLRAVMPTQRVLCISP